MNDAPPPDSPNPHPPGFTSYQKFAVAMLAFLQFTIVLDFMVLSPLGAILMPTLAIEPRQFGLVVSVYAIAAAISGVLAAGFADRYDRKKFLLFFYGGFLLGTVLCGIAPTYPDAAGGAGRHRSLWRRGGRGGVRHRGGRFPAEHAGPGHGPDHDDVWREP